MCRLCLGWLLALTEMKVLVATIFRGYHFQLLQPDSQWAAFPLARPKDGMPARFWRVGEKAASTAKAEE